MKKQKRVPIIPRNFTKDAIRTSFMAHKTIWVVALVIVSYFFIYKPVAAYVDKQRFLQAEKEIEKISLQIEEKIGRPDQKKANKSCSYSSQKSGPGNLSCATMIHLLYENRGLGQTNSMMQSAASVFETKVYDSISKNLTGKFFESNEHNRGEQDFSQNLNNIQGVTCGVQYFYPVKDYNSASFEIGHEENLRITIWCSDLAKAEHFPVNE